MAGAITRLLSPLRRRPQRWRVSTSFQNSSQNPLTPY